jgi:hypothetical protein
MEKQKVKRLRSSDTMFAKRFCKNKQITIKSSHKEKKEMKIRAVKYL